MNKVFSLPSRWLVFAYMCSTEKLQYKRRRHLPKSNDSGKRTSNEWTGKKKREKNAGQFCHLNANEFYVRRNVKRIYRPSVSTYDHRVYVLSTATKTVPRSRSFKSNLFLCDDWCTMIATTHGRKHTHTHKSHRVKEPEIESRRTGVGLLYWVYHYHVRHRIVLNKPNSYFI